MTSVLRVSSRGLQDFTTLQRMQADDEISGEKSNFQYVSLAIFKIPRDPVKMRQDCLKTPSRSLQKHIHFLNTSSKAFTDYYAIDITSIEYQWLEFLLSVKVKAMLILVRQSRASKRSCTH